MISCAIQCTAINFQEIAFFDDSREFNNWVLILVNNDFGSQFLLSNLSICFIKLVYLFYQTCLFVPSNLSIFPIKLVYLFYQTCIFVLSNLYICPIKLVCLSYQTCLFALSNWSICLIKLVYLSYQTCIFALSNWSICPIKLVYLSYQTCLFVPSNLSIFPINCQLGLKNIELYSNRRNRTHLALANPGGLENGLKGFRCVSDMPL